MTEKRTVTLTVNGVRYAERSGGPPHARGFHPPRRSGSPARISAASTACAAPAPSCSTAVGALVPDVRGAGRRPRDLTIEGIAPTRDKLHPLQEAFRDNHGLQCGFCTPGMLTTLIEFLRDNPDPTEQEVRIAISGNLCRCTGYQGIVAAALDAAKRLRAAPA